jgi:hypothetical protein
VKDHVGVLLEDLFRIGRNDDAPGRIRRSDNFAEVAADLGGIGINGANNFNGLLFPHQFCDGGADGTDTILDGANFLFHIVLRFSLAAIPAARPNEGRYTNGILCSKETITIMEFESASNEEEQKMKLGLRRAGDLGKILR